MATLQYHPDHEFVRELWNKKDGMVQELGKGELDCRGCSPSGVTLRRPQDIDISYRIV